MPGALRHIRRAGPFMRGAIAAILSLTPPAAVAVVAWSEETTPQTGIPWPAVPAVIAAIVAFAAKWWLDSRGCGHGRARTAEVVVIGVVVAAVLLAVAPALAAVVALLVTAGMYATLRAAAYSKAGMATTSPQLAQLAAGTAELVHAARCARSADKLETTRLGNIAAVDQFVDVFRMATSRAVRWSRLAEVLLAPVSAVAVVMTAGVALALPWLDVLVCSLVAPLACGAVTRLRERTRPPPSGGARTPRTPRAVARTGAELIRALWQLRRDPVAALVASAVWTAALAALAHGVALALATTIPMALQRGASAWPRELAVVAVVVAHAVLLVRSARLAQLGGAATLRVLSHALTKRIVAAPPEQLTDTHTETLVTMATKDVVRASGLVVHGLRPGVAAVLVPCTAIVTGAALLASGDREAANLLPVLVLGSWLASYAQSVGPVVGGLRRGLEALHRLPGR